MKKIMIAFWLLCSTIALSAQTLRQSVENGVQTSVRQSENHEWREAFATCRALDAMIGNGNPDLHYLVAKERFRLYYHIKKMPECRAQLALMENYARASKKNDQKSWARQDHWQYQSRHGMLQGNLRHPRQRQGRRRQGAML